jgi:26S proteasome regulatory subunit N6
MILCKELVQWSAQEKRIFLKQALETRLIGLLLETQQFQEALELIQSLLSELKKLDDKMALLDVHLLESKVYFATKNMAKSKAALTAARTVANSVYCPPLTQAALDIQSGLLHAEEKDFKTAYSYFFESMEAFASQSDSRSLLSLKYMLLCKIMLNLADEVDALVLTKLAVQHSQDRNILAMVQVADCYRKRSLKDFEKALHDYPQGNFLVDSKNSAVILSSDPI